MRPSNCHPELSYFVKGLCKSCYLKSPGKREANQRQYRRNLRKNLWQAARDRARLKQIPFSLTVEDIKIPLLCPVLNLPLAVSPLSEKGGPSDNSPTLDRIVPELGYVVGNVAVISHRANRIKNCGSAEEHRKIAAYIDGR